MNIFLFAETLEKLSKKEEQCSSLTTESESLRSQLAGEDIYTAFYNVKCFVSRTHVLKAYKQTHPVFTQDWKGS